MGVAVVTHPANSATLSWRTPPISYFHVHCWKQSVESYSATPLLSSRASTLIWPALPDPARDPALFANVMLGIDWIEDIFFSIKVYAIEVQAFCINFLAQLKVL